MIPKSYSLLAVAVLVLVAAVTPQFTPAFAQGTAFTYQGRLNDAGGLATGTYDLSFTLYDTNQPAGNLIAGPLTNAATAVSNGLFTTVLDFGAGVFSGPARWLEIAVRTNGGSSFSTLTPRQALTPTPYAVFANTASNVLGSVPSAQITGTISPAQLPVNVVTNQETGVTLGGAFSGNGGALTNLNASGLRTGTVPTNVLAGFQAPYYAFLGGGQNNTANNTYAVVAGGANNNASYFGAVGGGYNNNAGGYYATIPGGDNNTASGQDSFAAGQNAQALHQGAFVWADSQPGLFASTATDTFNVRAYGGVSFVTRGAPVTVNGLNVLTGNAGNFWQTLGNAGTSPASGNFLGTTDNQPLEVRVNNERSMRLEPATNGAPNVIGGASVNYVVPGIFGATIAGGGAANFAGFAYSNSIAGSFGSIGGGFQNGIQANTYSGTIGGGDRNLIQSNNTFSVISGGGQNSVMAYSGEATIGGGLNNVIGAFADSSTISGGQGNSCTNYGATVGGGGYDGTNYMGNIAGGAAATVGGGLGNSSLAMYATVSGGTLNSVLPGAQEAVIGGGNGNIIGTNAADAAICGGFHNTIQGGSVQDGSSSVISGGNYNEIDSGAYDSTITGGNGNWIQLNAIFAVIGGGDGNIIQTNTANAVIGGGGGNSIGIASAFSTVGGGGINLVFTNADHAVIAGGEENFIFANANHAVIGGGLQNQVGSTFSTVAGGFGNLTIGEAATVGGGFGNQATNSFATVPGGTGNVAGGSYSFAAGAQAQALHQGAFVWADSQGTAFASTANDQFAVRAQGGVQLDPSTSLYFGSLTRQMVNLYGTGYGLGVQAGTVYERSVTGFAWFKGGVHNNAQDNPGTGGTVLMTLSASGLTVNGTLASTSDRNAKQDFAPVNAQDVLAKVAAMPITKWIYKTDTGTRHIGPMAQDFYAAFAVGPDDKHITTVDEGGVALAAIQGLNQELNQQLELKETEITELKQGLADLKKQMQSLVRNQ